jgi:glutamyl-tRNA synthetase
MGRGVDRKMSGIRVRFAPSPTGSLHVGNLRTALFNWLHARKTGGKYILRIEDTDSARFTPGAESSLIDALKRLGLNWDEGPDIGGPHAPYRQSERLEKYRAAVELILKSGSAYPCYCSESELEAERKTMAASGRPPRYSGKCKTLSQAERDALERGGIKPVIRFLVDDRTISFHDGVRGEVTFNTRDIGDFVLMRSDGVAPYYMASAYDDVQMGITDVIRGEDHLSNTVRHILIMRAMGATPPRYHHLSIILDADGKKLSKRAGALDVAELLNGGYLPDAINTTVAMLGWAGISGKDTLQLEKLAEVFDISKASRSPAHFDPERLDHINARALKSITPQTALETLRPLMEQAGFPFGDYSRETLEMIASAVASSVHTPRDAGWMSLQFVKRLDLDDEAAQALCAPEAIPAVTALAEAVKNGDPLGHDSYETLMKRVAETSGVKGKSLFKPIRAALTGRVSGPNLKDILAIIGPDEALRRLNEPFGRK